MTTLTTQTLGDTVGAAVAGVDCERLLTDDHLPRWCLDALEANGVLVFKDLHIDDATQVAFSRMLGARRGVPRRRSTRDLPGHARPVEESRRRLPARHLRLAHRRLHRRRPDHGHGAQRARRRHVGRARPSSPAPTRPTRASRADEKERAESMRVVHTFEAAQRLVNADPSEQELAMWRTRPTKEHPLVWKHRSGRRSLVLGATADHIVGMDLDDGRALLDDLLERSTAPTRVYRHHWEVGDMVIWDNRGVLHRALPYDAASPRDMHRCTLAGDEVDPVTDQPRPSRLPPRRCGGFRRDGGSRGGPFS